jgi:hypothetical protein
MELWVCILQVLEAATGIALSTFLCYLGQQFSIAIGYPSASISVITLLTVVAATLFARQLNPFVSSSEGVAYILLQVCMQRFPKSYIEL